MTDRSAVRRRWTVAATYWFVSGLSATPTSPHISYMRWDTLGIPTGASRVEEDKVDLARELLDRAKAKGIKFLLPVDNIETTELKPGAPARTAPGAWVAGDRPVATIRRGGWTV